MTTAIRCAVIALLGLFSFQVFAADTQPADIQFSSTYTDLRKDCRDEFSEAEEGQDMPVICTGPANYEVHIDFSACCEQMRVEGKNDFELLFPEQKFITYRNRKLEWRLANGKPFAVIFHSNQYKGDISDPSSEKIGEVVIIKGLNGFPNIDHKLDIKQFSNPNQEAKRLADQGYKNNRIGIFTLFKGKQLTIDNQLKVTFRNHSHKRTREGQTGPLIIYMTYSYDNAVFKGVRHNVYHDKEDGESWNWNKYIFNLIKYKYDDYMTVEIIKQHAKDNQ